MKIKKYFFLVVFAVCSCSDKYCSDMIGSIENQCGSDLQDCQFSFSKTFDFEWDRLYIFDSMLYPDEISEKLGVDCECEILNDGRRLIVFIKDDSIVEKQISSCGSMSFVKMKEDGVVVIDYESTFRMERRELNDDFHYYFFKE